mgnify:CR=1 FL=1
MSDGHEAWLGDPISPLTSACKCGAAAYGADKSCHVGQHEDSAKAGSGDPISFLTSAGEYGATPGETYHFCYDGDCEEAAKACLGESNSSLASACKCGSTTCGANEFCKEDLLLTTYSAMLACVCTVALTRSLLCKSTVMSF